MLTPHSDLSPVERWTLAVQDTDGKVKVLYKPTDKGAEFHDCTIANAILEGPRGTGKSTILRNDAHFHALNCPGLTYLIVRRTMPELRKSHLRFIEHEMKLLGGHFNKGENVAYYPTDPVTGLQSKGFFGHCETDADVMIYLSSEFARLYLDEITTFTGDMILKLASVVRVPEESKWDAVLRGGTNPLGEGADFVKRWFIDRVVPYDEADDYDAEDYLAIRMTREDNPHLNWTKYDRRMKNLPEHVRRAWKDGEWVAEGSYFSDFKPSINGEPWHVIDSVPQVVVGNRSYDLTDLPWVSVYRCLDWGFNPDPAACLWIAMLPDGRGIVFKEKTWLMTTAKDVAGEIKTASADMRIVDTPCDPTMFVNDEALGGISIGRIMENNGVALTPGSNDRAAIGFAIHEWLNTVINGKPKLQIVRDACPMLIRTFPDMRQDSHNPRKIAEGNDHWIIALGYFCQTDAAPSREPETSSVPLWMRYQQQGQTFRIGAQNVR